MLAICSPFFVVAQWNALSPEFNSNKSITAQDHVLYVASYLTGIKASNDNGQSWTDKNDGLPKQNGFIYVESVGGNGTWLFAGTHSAIMRSNDGGANWTETESPAEFTSYNFADRFVTIGNATLAILTEDHISGGGILRTEDQGATWSLSDAGMYGCGKVNDVIIDHGILYASCTGGLFISSDLGANWQRSPSFNHLYSYSISSLDPNVQVMAGQYELNYTVNRGQTWNTATGPAEYEDVEIRFFDGRFIAVVNGQGKGTWQSTDGQVWSKMTGIVQVDEFGLKDTYQYGNVFYVGAVTNIYALEGSGVSLAPKVVLGGAYDVDAELMRDDLRQQNLIPMTEPFTALEYEHAGNGGNETTTSQSLQNIGNNAIVDWVLIELRDKNNDRIILETKSALLQRDGDIVDARGYGPLIFNLPQNEYYVAVRHGSHLGVMTQDLFELAPMPKPLDFTSGWTYTFGTDSRINLNGMQVLYPGNTNNDGMLRLVGAQNDRDAILEILGSTSISATLEGYFLEDVNMDGTVKYDGPQNDREALMDIIGNVPSTVILEQLP